MYTIITCPQCVHKLGRMTPGNTCILHCDKCKRDWEVTVDLEGGIHALPLKKPTTKKKKA